MIIKVLLKLINFYLFYWTVLIILCICAVTLKSPFSNSKLRLHNNSLSFLNCRRNITVCIVTLPIKSSFRHDLIDRQRNSFSSQSFFLIKLLSIIRSTFEFPSNLKFWSWFVALILFSSGWNVILIICTLTLKSSFW